MPRHIKPYTLDKKYKVYAIVDGFSGDQLIMSYDDVNMAHICAYVIGNNLTLVRGTWVEPAI